MRKFFPTLLVCLMSLSLFAQTMSLSGGATSLRGVIVDENDNHALSGIKVSLANQNIATTTNANGEFALIYLEPMDEEVIIEGDGYVSDIILVSIEEGKTTDLGNISLKQDIRREMQDEIILNLSEADLNDDEGKSQSMASGMSASVDVFNNTTAFAWSSARYRNRGYAQSDEVTYINGIAFNGAERGTFNYSALGGLNDASRNKEVVNGIEANNFTFGSIGQATNIQMSATNYAQGWKVGVAATNRNYKGRVTATYASGMLENGWAFVGQIAMRYAPATKLNIIGSGSDYMSLGYFFSAEKRWGNRHRLSLLTFGAPTMRGQSGAVTQEVYTLYGSNYYNPYWGFQQGKVRNSREVHSYDPTLIASYEWKITDKHVLKIGVGAHYSLYSNSALTFFNAPDPRPDYYRNMPSFYWDGQFDNHGNWVDKTWTHTGAYDGTYDHWDGAALGSQWTANDGRLIGPTIDPASYNALVDAWKSRDPQTTQINWDNLYAANYANNATNPGSSAKYMVERRHNDIREATANILYTNDVVDHLHLTAGLEMRSSQGVHYKSVDDLLGAQQWIDVDPFADRDLKELAANIGLSQDQIDHVRQNDVANPNKVVKDGNKFGYDYDINITGVKLWAQNEWHWNEVDLYYALQFNVSEFDRTSRMLNGRAYYLANRLDDKSDAYYYLGPQYKNILNGTFYSSYRGYQHVFFDPSFKLGATYRIDGHNKLRVNALAQTTPPLARDAYLSPRVHDRAISSIYTHDRARNLSEFYAASEKRVSADLTYEFTYPIVRGRITAYYTQMWNGTELNGYYDDEVRTFVNQSLTGINRRHVGVEAAAAVKLGKYFTLTPVVAYGDFRYTSDAMAVTSAENGMAMEDNADGNVYEVTDKVLINGLHVASGPQLNASLKLSFFHPKMWFADITISYFDKNYLDYAPSRRMYGLYYGQRWSADGTGSLVNGSYASANAIRKDEAGNVVTDKYGTPLFAEDPSRNDGLSIYHLFSDQESLVDSKVWNRFMIDASVGKLIYLPNRQSLSINLSVSNLTNNTHMKTGGYQQARLPRGTQGMDAKGTSYITPNVYKFPAKYYYAWGVNFFLSATYKF